MTATCPTCQLQEVFEPASASRPERFVCARCETVYEASPVAVPAQPAFSQECAAPAAHVISLPAAAHAPADDILSIPPVTDAETRSDAAVLEDVFARFMSEPAPEKSGLAVTPVVNASRDSEGQPAPPAETLSATPERAAEGAATTRPPAPSRTSTTPPPPDRYAQGVRLLRVAPAWLLATSFAFVSMLFVLSWMAQPVNQAAAPGTVAASRRNEATNQAVPPAENMSAQAEAPQQIAAPVRIAPAAATREATGPVAALRQQAPETQAPVADPAEAHPPQETAAQPTKEPAAEPANPLPPAGDGRFTVQVGAFDNRAQADERVAALRSAGLGARAVEVEIPKRGTWYRVQTGRFGSRPEATRHAADLRSRGLAENSLVAEIQD